MIRMRCISEAGNRVYKDFRENICCPDKDNYALISKTKQQKEKYYKGQERGLFKLGSVHSGDALCWSVFRTLEIEEKMPVFYRLLGIDDCLERTVFWTRDTGTGQVDEPLRQAVNGLEPRMLWPIQAEPDVILFGRKTAVFVECLLGAPGSVIQGWAASRSLEAKHHRYRKALADVCTPQFFRQFNTVGARFFQLLRIMAVGRRYAEITGREFRLCAIVNANNFPYNVSDTDCRHQDRFEEFKRCLVDASPVCMLAWQKIRAALEGDARYSGLVSYIQDRL